MLNPGKEELVRELVELSCFSLFLLSTLAISEVLSILKNDQILEQTSEMSVIWFWQKLGGTI